VRSAVIHGSSSRMPSIFIGLSVWEILMRYLSRLMPLVWLNNELVVQTIKRRAIVKEDLNILKKIFVKIENCFVNLLFYFYGTG
jgi:hypothetical protein